MSLAGFDLSNHNSRDWPATVERAFADGAFIIHKGTEGLTFKDAYHHAVIARARDAGKLVGHYHYPHPGHNGVDAELEQFLTFTTPRVGDVLALDFEPYADRDDGSITRVHLPSWILEFGAGVFAETGASCWLYLNGDWGDTVMAQATAAEAAALRQMPLWKATQGSSTPGRTWSWPVLTAWQWDASNNLDKDTFYGDATTWRVLGVQGAIMAHDPLDNADVTRIFTADVVPAPKDWPDAATNPTWRATSYLQEILAAARRADAKAAALTAALASTTALVNEMRDGQAQLASAVADVHELLEAAGGDVTAAVSAAMHEALANLEVTLRAAAAQP